MVKYYYENKKMIIEDYSVAKTFSSFLPAVAGIKGIPLWVFYVNRGQGVASFGTRDKNGSILEFSPANIAYKTVEQNGFRTFIKINGEVVEAFSSRDQAKRKMMISATQFSIVEHNEAKGYEIKVTYFGLPNENFGALVRKVELANISDETIDLEILDGCATIMPFGIENAGYKSTGNLFLSWMEVFNLENRIPFYKIRSSIKDMAEISHVNKGNFYLSFSNDDELLQPIVDSRLIFDYDTAYQDPIGFKNKSVNEIKLLPQITANKLPCGFSGLHQKLKPKEKLRINTLIGHIEDISMIEKKLPSLLKHKYIDEKEYETDSYIRQLTSDIETHSGMPLFDEYARQNYLDNFLRGGYPLLIHHKQGHFVYHVFSRKHGDPERDYNWFVIEPEYFSQGNGNYRDINQNRRNDVFFHPTVGTHNIKTFINLIQIDGYNPLLINGHSYEISQNHDIEKIVDKCFLSHKEELKTILQTKFTPGRIINYIENNQVKTRLDDTEIFYEIFSFAKENIEASFGEGYWVDHWIYNMDLIETYLQIFPDKKQDLLFNDKTYQYFYSPIYVLPRSEKYVLNQHNEVRQYGALKHFTKEECSELGIQTKGSGWLRKDYGKGDVYQTSLFVKLLNLAIIKFSSLDSIGVGIEMDANKPGWNDAMNGLPGLFGSSIAETFELIRLVNFLNEVMDISTENTVMLPIENITFIDGIVHELYKNQDEHHYWDQVSILREEFRNRVKYGINGEEREYRISSLKTLILLILNKLNAGIEKAKELGNGLYPTYLTFDAMDYEVIKDVEDKPIIGHYGLPLVKVHQFKPRVLPYFLEGPAKALKVIKNKEENESLHHFVQETDLFDKKIFMYKTSVSLENESYEIGRARASFTPGWLERESIFLHMTYKYLLGLLKSELYDEFFIAMKTNLIPFLDPKVYGRSTLENSSFIASSVNPDSFIHGQGFVPRLSGSTAEFISMWITMMYGFEPFSYKDDMLIAQFKPIIPSWLFNQEGKLSFKFLGHTRVTYWNQTLVDTYSKDYKIKQIQIYMNDNMITFEQDYLPEKYALLLREGKLDEVIVVNS